MKVVTLNVVMLVVKPKGVMRSEIGFNLLNSVSQVRIRLLWVLAMSKLRVHTCTGCASQWIDDGEDIVFCFECCEEYQ